MKGVSTLINFISEVAGKYLIQDDINHLNNKIYKYSTFSDEELRAHCKSLFKGIYPDIRSNKNWFKKIIYKITFLFNPKVEEVIFEQLACSIQAFQRCPADLPPTSLYPTQVQAALALTQTCIIQMNTGEGKTYALLPSAFTLACKYGRVYIVCANEYLAFRDAKRTKNYWDFVNLKVSYCNIHDSIHSKKWSADIIYTTLTTLLFKGLLDDIHQVENDVKLTFGAIIIDEVDAVLFDTDNGGKHSVTHPIKSNLFDWEFAVNYAKTIEENSDILVNRVNLTASLTVLGEAALKEHIKEHNIHISKFEVIRRAVEISYIALFEVREDNDYVKKGNTFYAFNRKTGQIEYNKTIDWLIPLETINQIPPRPATISLHELAPNVFLKQFNHISGISGTAKEDSAEYFFVFKLPIIIIQPRFPRYKGELNDEVYKTKQEAKDALIETISKAVEAKRPVLVGTQSIKDAEDIYATLVKKFGSTQLSLNLITGKDDARVASIYENGGHDNSVIIATQSAGRGVDIRLTETARKNGGLLLLSLERSRENRLDKQFLGRAGRQGDPFNAKFLVSLEDDLMTLFQSGLISNIMDRMGHKEGDVIEHKMVTNSIKRAQSTITENEFYIRRSSDYINHTEEEIYSRVKTWFTSLTAHSTNPSTVSEAFLLHSIDNFIQNNLASLIKSNLVAKDAGEIVRILELRLGRKLTLNPVFLEGKKAEFVHEEIKAHLLEQIRESAAKRDLQDRKLQQFARYFNKYYRFDFISHSINTILKSNDSPHKNSYDDKEDNKPIISADFDVKEPKDFKLLLKFLKQEKSVNALPDDALVEVLNRISNINTWRAWAKELETKVKKYNTRDSYQTAYWTLLKNWIEFRQNYSRTEHLLRNQQMTTLQFYRKLSEDLINDWDKTESNLSAELIKNQINVENVDLLDDLFYYADQEETNYVGKADIYEQELNSKWEEIVNSTTYEGTSTNNDTELIKSFIALNEEKLGLTLNSKGLYQLLVDFLANSPINYLNTPDKIIKALEGWKSLEITRGFTVERRELNAKWIKLFLIYLNDKKVISGLPTFKDKIQSIFDKFRKNLKDFQSLISIAQSFFWLGLFALLTVLGKWLIPIHSENIYFTLYNNILCAGLLSTGVATSFIFTIDIILKKWSSSGANYLKLLLSFATSFVLCFVNINNDNYHFKIEDVPEFIIVFYFSYRFLKFCYEFYKTTEINLGALWISISILYAFLISTILPLGLFTTAIFLGVFVYYILICRSINSVEFVVASSYIFGSLKNLNSELTRTCIKTDGNTGATPYVYALISSLILYSILANIINEHVLQIIIYCFYFFILAVISFENIHKRFLYSSWQSNLNANRQMLIDKNNFTDVHELSLKDELESARKKVLLKGMVQHVIIFGIVTSLLHNNYFPNSNFPISLVLIAVAFLLGEQLSSSLKQLYNFFILRNYISTKVLDFKEIKEPDEDKTFSQKILDFLNPVLKVQKILNYLFIAIFTGYTIYRVLKLFKMM